MLKTIRAKFADGEVMFITLGIEAQYGNVAEMPTTERTLMVLRETAGAWQGSHSPSV